MGYATTQDDINLLLQNEKVIYIRIELLNNDNKIINSLESELISASSTIDAESASRVSFTCSFVCADDSWIVNSASKVWVDRRIRPYIGYYSVRLKKIMWYKIGTLKFNTAAYSYDTTTNEVSLQCLDLMSTMDGTLGGNIHSDGTGATTVLIEADSDIRGSIIALLEDAGITKYDICQFNRKVPYDLEYDMGTTYYDILSELIGLYAGYEMYFDEDGIFVIRLTPMLKSDPNILTDDILSQIVISEQRNYDFSQAYNYCEVFGEEIEPDYYTETTGGSTSTWTATISEYTEYTNRDTVALKAPYTNTSSLKININSLGAKSVLNDDNAKLTSNFFEKGKVYCFRYRADDNTWIYLGQYQAFGTYEEKSADCPFSTTNLGYKIPKVLIDNDIYSDSLCEQRAKYEVYKGAWLTDTMSLSLIDVPFLTVNQKISYTPQGESAPIEYVTKKITKDIFSGSMSLEMTRFSEEYPDMETVYQNQYT